MLGDEGRRPAADLVVLVSVGKRHEDDRFFVVPVGVLYDFAEGRHRAYWAARGGAPTGERELVQIRDDDPDVREFLKDYRDAWTLVTEPSPRAPGSSSPSSGP